MANSPKVFFSYEHETEANLFLVVKQTINGCTGNTVFTITIELHYNFAIY